MNVGIISTRYDSTGIGTYSKELYRSLSDLLNVSKVEVDFESRSIREIEGEREQILHRGLRLPLDHPGFFILRSQWSIPDKFDLYHMTLPAAASFELEPQVVTVHDMIKFKFPRRFSEKIIRKVEYGPVRSADHIVTVSNTSKRDIIELLGINEQKVSTVYPGVHKKYRPLNIDEDTVREKYNLPKSGGLVLYLGSEEPRKNVPTVVKACAAARRQGQAIHFIKAGSAGTFGERTSTKRAVQDAGMEDNTTFLEFVPEDDLPELYNIADVFLFPSEYEGFGLPPLEAMACGTPVITSNRASLPEVVGDAGITTAPNDTEIIADHLIKVLSDESLKQRLREEGLQRAEQFSWQQTADQLAGIYREVYEKGSE
ncbi:glycosyltransferase family 4 protein [Halorubrum ezzemoulense]|uniref:Glycosyltransferase family 1 protein n=1 Tax=Halorubrum ezzemoulense TaxID=337243 RepID=A0A256JEN6_HALEZ|nr:glycosyltransferase family 1 protein [Halorubrum ezzemoulense]OYR67231.1 hypothetical protein DJ78_16310 [Halorubrum ezzemoulense]